MAAPHAPEAPGRATAWLLAAMAAVVPAVGMPSPLVLQDTLKSALVALFTLAAALAWLWPQRRAGATLRWHPVLALPLLLALHALGSMAWSHAYLGGVEAIRWALFALLAFLGLNTLGRERWPALAWGLHAGALAAALWAGGQFWLDWQVFPQGPNPGSTFLNRNFLAEYLVCAMPFSAWLLARSRGQRGAVLLAASLGLLVVAVLMTGTRTALAALALLALVGAPLAAWRCRDRWACDARRLALAAGVLATTVLALGALPTGNPQVLAEHRGETPLARAFTRAQSVQAGDPSLNLRLDMWRATVRMAAAHPVAGVGAGAWEVEIPRWQAPGAQLETDYYAHNEPLQAVAEYGVAGWAFLLGLLAWCGRAGWATLRDRSPSMDDEAPGRLVALCALGALGVVSVFGFPWRLAGTGMLFALAVGLLAASDARLAAARARPAQPAGIRAGLALAAAGLALACFITWQAVTCERRLVRSVTLAATLGESGRPGDPRWEARRAEVVRLAREGVAINPHYRKITPAIADELARWGDWMNATWIWESVLASRPHVVAIMSNTARGHAALGQPQLAWSWLDRAKALQPNAPAVASLEVVLLAREGHEAQALARAREALDAGVTHPDLLQAAFVLALRAQDRALARRAMALAAPAQREAMARALAQP